MMSRNSAAVRICLLVEIVSLWRLPLKIPTGPSGLELTIATRTSSVDIPAFESATGLSAIRTAGWSAPLTLTSPTPGTCEMRWAITVSATSYIALVVSVFEVSASTNTGAADGLALRNRGNDGRSLGRSASEALIAACTSRAARSMLRPIANCSWMLVLPSELVEVIWSMPDIWPSRRSSGAATVAAITDGSAPGREADTRIDGKSTLGTDDDRQEDVGDDPDQEEPDRQQRGAHRPADEGLRDRCHYCIPSVAPATGGPVGPGSGTAFSILRLSRSSAR